MELNVRPFKIGVRFQETCAQACCHCHWYRSLNCVFCNTFNLLDPVVDFGIDSAEVNLNVGRACKWSWKFFPTPRSSKSTNMPNSRSSLPDLMLESIRICGDPVAPADRITSRFALTLIICPFDFATTCLTCPFCSINFLPVRLLWSQDFYGFELVLNRLFLSYSAIRCLRLTGSSRQEYESTGLCFLGPASTMATVYFPLSLKPAATAHPADPAPITT